MGRGHRSLTEVLDGESQPPHPGPLLLWGGEGENMRQKRNVGMNRMEPPYVGGYVFRFTWNRWRPAGELVLR